MKYLRYLLALVPITIILEFLRESHILPISEVIIFVLSALALIPLAGLLGEATEELAIHAGPRVGGLLNATFGNAAELIITIIALQKGLNELVKASITGSIIGNLLLVLGFSLLMGGLKNGTQFFNRRVAGTNASMMTLALIGLFIPAIFAQTVSEAPSHVRALTTEEVSVGVAIILIILYALSLLYSLRGERDITQHYEQEGEASIPTPMRVPEGEMNDTEKATYPLEAIPADEMGNLEAHPEPAEEEHKAKWSVRFAVGMLALSTVGVAWLSEILVGVIEPVVATLGISEIFLGLIIIPIVGNVAEHVVGVQVALKNKMDLSLAVSVGSSMQIALFVAPLLVFISMLVSPHELMNFVFTPFELAAVGVTVFISTLISVDGESNWLEGAQLLAVYIILGVAFFFLP